MPAVSGAAGARIRGGERSLRLASPMTELESQWLRLDWRRVRKKDLEDTRDLPLHYTPMEGAAGASDSEELPPGTAVGTYVIKEKIASGGGGTVYRAEDPA